MQHNNQPQFILFLCIKVCQQKPGKCLLLLFGARDTGEVTSLHQIYRLPRIKPDVTMVMAIVKFFFSNLLD